MKTGVVGFSGDFLGVGVGLASGVGTGGNDAAFLTRRPDWEKVVKAQTMIRPATVKIAAVRWVRNCNRLLFIKNCVALKAKTGRTAFRTSRRRRDIQ